MDNVLKPSVYISSSCFEFKKLDELLSFCKDNRLYNLELSGNLGFEADYASKLGREKEFTFLVHNYFPVPKETLVLNLASSNQEIREKSLQICQRAIKLCQQLGVPFYSVHGGFLVDLKPEDLGKKQSHLPYIDKEMGMKIFKEAVNQLLEFMKKDNIEKVDLLIENNVASQVNLIEDGNKLYLLTEPEETRKFFDEFDNPRLGLLLDVGHLNVSAKQLKFDKQEFVNSLSDKIKAFHLSENNGLEDEGLAFDEKTWFMTILKQEQFREMVKIIEINKDSQLTDLLKCVKIVNSL